MRALLNLGLSIAAASAHLILGYVFFHSDLFFFGQGSPIVAFLFVPFISFPAAHSVPIATLNFLLLFTLYFFLIKRVSRKAENEGWTFLLMLLIPAVNVACFALLFFK